MTTRSIVSVLVTTLMLAAGGPATAQQSKCLAGKIKCVAKKGTGLIKCHQLAETPGKPADPNANACLDKAMAKFDGGVEPAKGCFEKLENKAGNDCITTDDTAAAEAEVDACVAAFVEAIDPAPIDQTKCGAGKKKCVSKLLKALLKCEQLARTPGKPADPNATGCVDKALAKYNGGPEPVKGCFEKLENKTPNDCQFFDDTGTLQTLVANCVDEVASLLTETTTTTSTTIVTTTTTSSTTTSTTCPPITGEIEGALTPTLGRFNYAGDVGLDAANEFCDMNFACTHACEINELLAAESAGELVGLTDIASNAVTGFWVIDPTLPPLQQCQDDVGSFLNWEYGTAHTASRGPKIPLNNATGDLGAIAAGQQCALLGTPSWVGCCR